jgi:hypothetical protein
VGINRKSTKGLPKAVKLLLYVLALLLPAGFMTYKIMSSENVLCEVCMEFRGRSKCRSASGPTKKECLRTAVDNACAFLASGMTDSIACSQTTPVSVK